MVKRKSKLGFGLVEKLLQNVCSLNFETVKDRSTGKELKLVVSSILQTGLTLFSRSNKASTCFLILSTNFKFVAEQQSCLKN